MTGPKTDGRSVNLTLWIRQDERSSAMIIRGLVLGATLLFASIFAFAQVDANEISKHLGLGTQGELSDSKIASGLKQALQVGAENTVKLTGRPDGYFGNEAIKILMPKNLQPLEKGLRAVGQGDRRGRNKGMGEHEDRRARRGETAFHGYRED